MSRAMLGALTIAVSIFWLPLAANAGTLTGDCYESQVFDITQVKACTRELDSGRLSGDALAVTYFLRAEGWEQTKSFDDAIADYSRAIAIKPLFGVAYAHRGAVLLDKGKFDDALTDLNMAIKLEPKYAPAYSHRGILWAREGKFPMALDDFSRSLSIDPMSAPTNLNMGTTFAMMGRIGDALKCYTRAIELNPRYAEAYRNRALVWGLKGEAEKKQRDLDSAKQFQGQN